MKKLWKQVAAAVMSGAMMLSFAGAVKADDYYINDLGEEGFQERVEEVQNEGPFYDVARSAWYCGAVEYCKTSLLLTGDPDGNFRPEDPVSRAEAATVLKRLATDETFYYETYFSDVPNDAWYAQDASSYGNLLGGNSRQESASSPLGYSIILALCTQVRGFKTDSRSIIVIGFLSCPSQNGGSSRCCGSITVSLLQAKLFSCSSTRMSRRERGRYDKPILPSSPVALFL